MRRDNLNILKWGIVLLMTLSLLVYFYYQIQPLIQENMSEEEEEEEEEGEIEDEKNDKLQKITQETTNLTNRIQDVISKSTLDLKEMTDTNLNEMEDTKNKILQEKEEVAMKTIRRINEIQQSIQAEGLKPEKGVHVEVI